MRKQPYPAAAAHGERRVRRASAEAELARAGVALADRQAALAGAEQALRAHAAALGADAQPRGGVSSGSELARAGAYARRKQLELAERRAGVERAQAAVSDQLRRVERAQRALAQAIADERVIERHRARHDAAQQRERERAEELELDETALRSRP